ncbi:SurA N-terminal domain-containing protein [bacterium]|nr:SurA N-terminal domain-containing protein [bacterium]
MQKKLRSYFPLFLSSLILILTLASSCDKTTKKQSAIIPEEETIAVINNKKITLAKFQARLYSFLQHYRDLITADGNELGEIKSIVINQLINEELINQEASRKGIQVSEEELESIIAESLSSYEQSNLNAYLQNSDLTEEEWKATLRQFLVQKKLIQEEVVEKIPITKREIQSYYQNNRDTFVIPAALRVRNITLSIEGEAQAIRSQLLRGSSFKELIKQHSISPDKILDGDLGFITRGDLPEEMESEIFGTKFNQFKPRVTDVIRSQDGFHVFMLEQFRPARNLDLEEAKSEIKQILIEQKWNEYYTQWLERLRKNASVSIDEKMLQREEGF